ncbi:hypothetical protein [Caballeronia sp. CLC5]|uniref:hypothetical protein n=1 Tax=Caballeronia sp. CLC5 TaxID=2906764 RepID=UPI001F2AF00B|nr:hypothetical protein [Caballeronia sp. CLC5]MCE4575323.1 hypothetical protein [Caballeronia sp. CLC5]
MNQKTYQNEAGAFNESTNQEYADWGRLDFLADSGLGTTTPDKALPCVPKYISNKINCLLSTLSKVAIEEFRVQPQRRRRRITGNTRRT